MPKALVASVAGFYLVLFGALLTLFVGWDAQPGAVALTAGTGAVCTLPAVLCAPVLLLHRG